MARLLLILALLQTGVTGRQIEGTVLDAQGLPITGAHITMTERTGSSSKTAVSTADRFRVDGLNAAIYDVRVEADGFGSQTVTADLRAQSTAAIEIRLQPGRQSQEVIVAATRTEQRLGDIPASASVITKEEIQSSPAVVADDVLRSVPTFSLFRRTSSLASHPTSQGVSLRGIGPSGVSRTLVLLDDVPFNDPFGGWVYWTRVPLMSTDKIEIVDGSNSSIYGNYALGGVINIVSSKPTPLTIIVKPQYGSRHTHKVDLFASDAWNNWGMALEATTFDTDGYPIVAASERGLVDENASVSYQNADLKLTYDRAETRHAFLRGGYFSEDRNNGKVRETNNTIWKFVSGGVHFRLPDQSDFRASMFGNFETFHSTFLAVPAAVPPRSVGRLTLLQKVPTKDTGTMAQWSRAFSGNNYVTIGTDWRWVKGNSLEDGLDGTTGTTIILNRVSGGTQQSLGFFLQDLIKVTSRLQLTLSARVDHWRNYNAHNLETVTATGLPNGTNNKPALPEKKNTVGSPHIGGRYTISEKLSAWSALSWGFRAPTLNELYRQFRVGAILTLANEQLGPERLLGSESGINWEPVRNLTWRHTFFADRFKNPVSNVTLPTPANTRQRQNLGRTRIYGIQSDIEYRFRSLWKFSAAYVYDMATVREYPADPALVGKLLPQVPKHRGTVEVMYNNPRIISVSADTQFVARQFDDDPNTLTLPGYGVVNFNLNHEISEHASVFFGAQNLFNRTFLVMKNPSTVGAPRTLSGGIKLNWSGR